MRSIGGERLYIRANSGPVEKAYYCQVRTTSGESFVPALRRVHAQDSQENIDIHDQSDYKGTASKDPSNCDTYQFPTVSRQAGEGQHWRNITAILVNLIRITKKV